MQVVYELAPVIAEVISAHCPGTSARQVFIRACFRGDWAEAKSTHAGGTVGSVATRKTACASFRWVRFSVRVAERACLANKCGEARG